MQFLKNMPEKMLIVLDTNILIRFFTRDIEEKAIKVKNLLESDSRLLLPDVVLPELEYILTQQYNISRKELIIFFTFLTTKDNIKSSKEAKEAVSIYESSKLDMADCIIAAYSLNGQLASFDKELLKIEGVTQHWQ